MSHEKVLQGLLNWCFKNTNILQAVDGSGGGLIHFASINGYLPIVEKLVEQGVDVNLKGWEQSTPLHYSAWNGNTEISRVLIGKGANVNAQDEDKMTPLHEFARAGHMEIVNLLIENGADVNAQDKDNWTPLFHSVESYEAVTKLLIDKGANVNHQDKQNPTALHKAAFYGHSNIAKTLIDSGCHLQTRNIAGKTALDLALERKHEETAHLITQEMLVNCNVGEDQSQQPPDGNLNECGICYENKIGNFILQPCGHASLCEACCIRSVGSNCPMCRVSVTHYQRIFP